MSLGPHWEHLSESSRILLLMIKGIWKLAGCQCPFRVLFFPTQETFPTIQSLLALTAPWHQDSHRDELFYTKSFYGKVAIVPDLKQFFFLAVVYQELRLRVTLWLSQTSISRCPMSNGHHSEFSYTRIMATQRQHSASFFMLVPCRVQRNFCFLQLSYSVR